MTLGTALALLLAAVAVAFILAPLFRADAAHEERLSARLSEEEDLLTRREMATASLRDLEDDRATGKIGDDDYVAAKAELTARAVGLMKQLDAIESRRAHPRPESVRPDPPVSS